MKLHKETVKSWHGFDAEYIDFIKKLLLSALLIFVILVGWVAFITAVVNAKMQARYEPPAATIHTCNGDIKLHYSERVMVIGARDCVRLESLPEYVKYSPALVDSP